MTHSNREGGKGPPELDPEDKETELWAPAAPTLFSDQARRAPDTVAPAASGDGARVPPDGRAAVQTDRILNSRRTAEPLGVDRQCRMCGRLILSPRRVSLRGPAVGQLGFRCELCGNLFCARHIARVSGLLESLLFGARFRCRPCVPVRKRPAV